MILSEHKKESMEKLENLRKQYDYLVSDQTLALISEEQFLESKERIIKQTDKIIEEWGFTEDDLDEAPFKSKVNDMFSDIDKMLKEMLIMTKSSGNKRKPYDKNLKPIFKENWNDKRVESAKHYNEQVHDAIDEVADGKHD